MPHVNICVTANAYRCLCVYMLLTFVAHVCADCGFECVDVFIQNANSERDRNVAGAEEN